MEELEKKGGSKPKKGLLYLQQPQQPQPPKTLQQEQDTARSTQQHRVPMLSTAKRAVHR